MKKRCPRKQKWEKVQCTPVKMSTWKWGAKQGSIAKRTRKSGFKDDIHFLKVKKFSKRKHNTQTVQVNMDVSTKGMNEWVGTTTHAHPYILYKNVHWRQILQGRHEIHAVVQTSSKMFGVFFLQAKATRHKCYQKCHNQESVKGAESSSFLMKFVRKRMYNEQKQWNNNINKVAATITIDIKSFSVVGPQWLNEFQRICI